MKMWSDKNTASAQALIDWLLSERSERGWVVNWVNDIAFFELASLSDNQHPPPLSLIMKTLKRMAEQQKHAVADFEEEYERVTREEVERQEYLKWTFLFPLDVEISAPHSFTVLGTKFTLRPFDSVAVQLRAAAISALEKWARGAIPIQPPGAALLASTSGRSWQSAWQKIEPALDSLRGGIELSIGLGSWRQAGEPKPRRKIPHPPLMVIRGGDAKPDSWRFVSDRPTGHQFHRLTLEQIQSVKRLSPIFRAAPSPRSTSNLIVNCLRLYVQAMEAEEHHSCFMGLWQMAEAICLSETFGGDPGKVAARLAWHGERLNLKGSGYSAALRRFVKKRNDIVHRGIHRIEEQDVNILKLTCEIALWWLIEERARIPDRLHLTQFYRYKDANDAELRAVRRSSSYVERRRQKGKPPSQGLAADA